MTRVVDASVVFKALVPEEHSALARRVIETDELLVAPDLLGAEVANALWKRRRRGQMSDADVTAIIAEFHALGVSLIPSAPLLVSALRIAAVYDRTVYDSLYLALAEEMDATLVTADEKLFNAISRGSLAQYVAWIANVAH